MATEKKFQNESERTGMGTSTTGKESENQQQPGQVKNPEKGASTEEMPTKNI